ncbi:hypothetical protein GGI19_001278 [Coemansia pectinata]|uniref:Adhesin domain-containing protein n=1 Tax=Coemansia pectinata TaxID=1052879 RepID=A0A9W8GYG1_9FUNG|nr:hypothetical protein GGI19_001278 [Coemansia pectinata]
MDNDFLGHNFATTDEPLPPYSPFEPITESDNHAEGAPTWEPPQPLEWLEQPHEPVVVATGPTDMVVLPSSRSTQATQLLHPAKGISLKLEGLKAVKVTVRVDNERKYNGLVCIAARFCYNPMPFGFSESPVRASSSPPTEKSDQVQIEFSMVPEHTDSHEVYAELDLVLPRDAATVIPSLVLRLPANSLLEAVDVASNIVERIDAAVVSGAVKLEHVNAGSLRMAIGDGHIKAMRVTVSHGPAEFVAIRGNIHIAGCTANGHNVRVNSPDAAVKLTNIVAGKLHIQAARATTGIYSAAADIVVIESVSGHLTLDGIVARVLKVSAETSPVTGCWDISELVRIVVASAIIQGRLAITGNGAHAYIATSEWPVRLSIRKDYVGYFDIKATNSVVNLGLAGAILSKDHPHHRQGTIGDGINMLHIESTNSPVVIDTY